MTKKGGAAEKLTKIRPRDLYTFFADFSKKIKLFYFSYIFDKSKKKDKTKNACN